MVDPLEPGALLILAPSGHDAVSLGSVFERERLMFRVCSNLAALCRNISEDSGAILVTDEALAGGDLDHLAGTIRKQPPWSDLMLIVLSRREASSKRAMAELGITQRFANVSYLERPLASLEMVSVVRAALRARCRQRDLGRHTIALDKAVKACAEADRRLRFGLAAGRMVPYDWVMPIDPTEIGSDRENGEASRTSVMRGDTPKKLFELVHRDDRARLAKAWVAAGDGDDLYDIEYRIQGLDGTTKWLADRAQVQRGLDGSPNRLVGVHIDITEHHEAIDALRASEKRSLHLALHDPLTGLANRTFFGESLILALAEARRQGGTVAVVFIDLDDFKAVNDTLGHRAGDTLLVEAARRLSDRVRAVDTVARLGGDEFAIMLHDRGPTSAATIEAVTTALVGRLSHPFVLEGGPATRISASAGVTLAPADGDDPETLMKNADLALYRAKADGRSQVRFFDPSMALLAASNKAIEVDLREAIEAAERADRDTTSDLMVHYQPQVDLKTGRVVAVEALLRWQRRGCVSVAPDRFVKIAERCGLMNRLGTWVLNEACERAVTWNSPGSPPVALSVNVSPAQWRGSSLSEAVDGALIGSGLAASDLTLELTEDAFSLADEERCLEALTDLRGRGIRVSVDDLGTGHSSLIRLRRLPLDEVKIDRSFVAGVGRNRDDEAIVRAVLGLAHGLDLEVVAEGIETEHQLEFLKHEQCRLGQGYLFAMAMSAEAMTAFLAAAQPAPLPPPRPSERSKQRTTRYLALSYTSSLSTERRLD